MVSTQSVILFLAGLLLSPLVPKSLDEIKTYWTDDTKRPMLHLGLATVAIVGIILFLISEDGK